MVFMEVFLFLLFILCVLLIIRWAVKRFRQAGVKGKMAQIEETEDVAESIRQFKKQHPNPDRDRDEVGKF